MQAFWNSRERVSAIVLVVKAHRKIEQKSHNFYDQQRLLGNRRGEGYHKPPCLWLVLPIFEEIECQSKLS